jgi:branched-chain amino acid aminotransferase
MGAAPSERVVYLNGELVPQGRAVLSVFDRSVQYGDAVYDAARTFAHRPFKLREHIDRLLYSCAYTRMPLRASAEEVEKWTLSVLERNLPLLGPDDEDMIWWSVTRGVSSRTRLVSESTEATVIIYTFPVPFAAFAPWLTRGARVVTPATRRTPPECLDPRAKVSNKMNHILADFEVKGADPDAYSLMLDTRGYIAENSGGNFFFVRDGRLHTAGAHTFLEGVTRATILELAAAAGLPVVTGDFSLFDVYVADEAFLTATSFTILPVARVNGKPLGQGAPGPITRQLLARWSDLVGVDIVAEAQRHLPRTDGGASAEGRAGRTAAKTEGATVTG